MFQKRLLKILPFLIILISSCTPLPKGWDWGLKPRPIGFYGSMPSTETIYGQGFREGCAAGWKSTGKGLLGDIKVGFDAKMIASNRDYSSGWSDGYNYCVDTADWDVP